MSDPKDIVQRLRAAHDLVSELPEARGMAGIMQLLQLRNMVPEAADLIEALEAEVIRLTPLVTMGALTMGTKIEALEAEVERLKESLRHNGDTFNKMAADLFVTEQRAKAAEAEANTLSKSLLAHQDKLNAAEAEVVRLREALESVVKTYDERSGLDEGILIARKAFGQ